MVSVYIYIYIYTMINYVWFSFKQDCGFSEEDILKFSYLLLFIFFFDQWWPSLISYQHKQKSIKLHRNREPYKEYYRWIYFQIWYMVRFRLWCLMSLSTIFQLFRGCQGEETGVLVENHQPVASH